MNLLNLFYPLKWKKLMTNQGQWVYISIYAHRWLCVSSHSDILKRRDSWQSRQRIRMKYEASVILFLIYLLPCQIKWRQLSITERRAALRWDNTVCNWEINRRERRKSEGKKTKRINNHAKKHNNEHSPDWPDCITHQLSWLSFSSFPGVPAAKSFKEKFGYFLSADGYISENVWVEESKSRFWMTKVLIRAIVF